MYYGGLVLKYISFIVVLGKVEFYDVGLNFIIKNYVCGKL